MGLATVKLVDSTFPHANAMGFADERRGEHPASFRWERKASGGYLKVWTDLRLEEAVADPTPRKIAWLIEPPGLSSSAYEKAEELASHFDTVLTYVKELVDKGDPFKFYPFGGSRLAEWGLFHKTKEVSLLTSDKHTTAGHKLRHTIAEGAWSQVELYGEPYTKYIQSKMMTLRPFRYSIIIESDRRDWYFTEKLIDAFSQGTVPIYWGCPDIGKFFDEAGLISFESAEELDGILPKLGEADYESRREAIAWNLEAARDYVTPEDWVSRAYPELLS